MDQTQNKELYTNSYPKHLLCLQYNLNLKSENKVNVISNYNTFLHNMNHKYLLPPEQRKDNQPEDYGDYIKLDNRRNYEETDLFSMQNVGKIMMMKRKLTSNQLIPQPQPLQQPRMQTQPVYAQSMSQSQSQPQSLQHIIPLHPPQQQSQFQLKNSLSPDGDNIIRNNLNFPNDNNLSNFNGNDNNIEASLDLFSNIMPKTNEIQQIASTAGTGTGGEDIDKLIVLFPQLTDVKAKDKTVKKFVAYYKKHRYDELKITSFFMSLSSQINESSTETKSWIHYEYIRTRLESNLTSICKEMCKLVAYLQANNLSIFNGEITITYVVNLKQLILAKIRDYLECAIEEGVTISSKPYITKFIENYNPTRRKKKDHRNFYKDKLTKKIKEIFEKNQIIITEDKINALFYVPTKVQILSDDDLNNMFALQTNTNGNGNSNFNVNGKGNGSGNERQSMSYNEKNSFNSIDNSSKLVDEERNMMNSHNSNNMTSSYQANPHLSISLNSGGNRNSMPLVIHPNYQMHQRNAGSYQKKNGVIEPKYNNRYKVKRFSEDDF